MSALQAQLDAAVDVDSLRFSGTDYADARFGAVKGRIARRRAARSAGIGGASLVGVGAVAFGAGQVPWSGFVLGSNPGGSPTVVCTTSTPDAVAGSEFSLVATSPSPSSSTEADSVHKSWVLVSGSGVNETALANLHLDGDTVTASVADGSSSAVLRPGTDGLYRLAVADGPQLVFSVVGDDLVLEASSGSPEPAASVTCLTASPEPRNSESPSVSESPRPSESAAAMAPSPFECGYTLAQDTRNDNGLFVTQSEWLSAGDAEQRIRAEYEDPAAAGIEMSGDDVPVAIIDYNIFSSQFATNGMAVSGAPTDGGGYVLGYDFVIASDGVVVATYTQTSGDRGIYFEFANGGTANVFGLDVRAESFTACPGVEPSAVAAGDLFAVAGVNPHNGKGPYYAWSMIKG